MHLYELGEGRINMYLRSIAESLLLRLINLGILAISIYLFIYLFISGCCSSGQARIVDVDWMCLHVCVCVCVLFITIKHS